MKMKKSKIFACSVLTAAFMAFTGMCAQASFSDGVQIRKTTLDGYVEETSTRYGYGYIQTISLGENDSQTYPELAEGLRDYSEEMKNSRTESFNQMIERGREFPEDMPGNLFLEVDLLPVRTDDTVFSFLEYYQDYGGGAHGYYMFTGHNFDPATGKEYTLDQMVADEDAFRNAVDQVLKEKYPDSSIGTLGVTLDNYGSGADQTPFNWVMGADAILVYFNPYDIASYAEGVFVADIRFADYPDLFTGICRPVQGGYGMKMKMWTTEDIDLDGDGTYSGLMVGADSGNPDIPDWYDTLTVKVNDTACRVGNTSFYEAEPYLIRSSSGKYYLYVTVTMENDYRDTFVFGFVGNSPYLAGSAAGGFGDIYDEESSQEVIVYPTDPDHILMSERGNLLSTYTISRYYRVGEDGMPEPAEEFYTCNVSYSLKTVIPLPAQPLNAVTMEPEGEKIAVPAGEELKIKRTDGEKTVDLERSDGSMVRVTLDGTRWPRTIDGVDEGEYFEQLYYAG